MQQQLITMVPTKRRRRERQQRLDKINGVFITLFDTLLLRRLWYNYCVKTVS